LSYPSLSGSGIDDRAYSSPAVLCGRTLRDAARYISKRPRPNSKTGNDGCFMPSGMFVGQFLALVIDLGLVVIDVKEVSRH
jgi:hypothetical protein